jgi:hypothetical protein
MERKTLEPGRASLWALFAAAAQASGEPAPHAGIYADEMVRQFDERFEWNSPYGYWQQRKSARKEGA